MHKDARLKQGVGQTKESKTMKLISNLILFVLFLFVGIYVLYASAYKPLHNWDIIMYIAATKSYEEPDIKSLHAFTYSALQHSLSESEYKQLVAGKYRQAIYTDPSAFEEQLPFYQIRLLYTTAIYLLYKAGVDIGFATHIVSGIAVTMALALLYIMSASILGHPFCYSVPFFALIFGVADLARYSTPDGMAFLAVIFSAYLYFRDRIVLLLIFLPLMLCIRTDLILYTIPLLFVIFASKREYRTKVATSILMSVLLYFLIGALSKNPGWSTIFYFTFVQHLTHPLSMPYTLTANHYLHALVDGLKGIKNSEAFLLFSIFSLYCLGAIINRATTTSFFCALRSPAASLPIVFAIFVFSHFVLFPVVWNRFFIGPYLIVTFSLLIMMTDYFKMTNAAQHGAAPNGNSSALHCRR